MVGIAPAAATSTAIRTMLRKSKAPANCSATTPAADPTAMAMASRGGMKTLCDTRASATPTRNRGTARPIPQWVGNS